ncbi:MAG: cytochrome P450 [Rhizobiaceae bacterium]
MEQVNRFKQPIVPADTGEIDFMNQELMECPYHAYSLLREEAPVWRDPTTGFWVVSRYEDVRAILMDPRTFSSSRRKEDEQVDSKRVQEANKLYLEKGWLPDRTLALRDDPEHAQLRTLFDHAFRAGRIKQLDPYVGELAYRLMREAVAQKSFEFVRAFAVPFPLIVIGNQMGVPEEDIWKIKTWTEAFCHRTGLMQKEDSAFLRNVEQEIEAQHYFQPLFERLRAQPDGSLLSDLVNEQVPGWGRPLNENELHAEMMADTFVGGSETSTNALSAGVMLLARDKDAWRQLKSDPEKYLRGFIEEVLRLESPVQSRLRRTTRDVEIAGTTIPEGSFVDIRFGSANRDAKRFECPEKLDLERRNAATHMAFGSGVHHCLGAPLARRELFWGFKAFVEMVDDFEVDEDKSNLRHVPNFWLRSLKELHVDLT